MPAPTQPAATLQKDGLKVSVALTNTGSVDSAKTVQLYVRQTNVADAPLRQLAALAKVFVPKGQTVHVELDTAEYGGVCGLCVIAEDGTSSVPVGTKYSVSVGDGGEDYFAGFTVTAA